MIPTLLFISPIFLPNLSKISQLSRDIKFISPIFLPNLSKISPDIIFNCNINLSSRSKKIIKYDLNLLHIIELRSNCFIYKNYIDIHKLNSKTIIQFKCKCGIYNTLQFISLYKGSALCKNCKTKLIKEKMKKTNLLKYNFPFPSQNEKIKEKIKQTCLLKYGYQYPSQNTFIAEKQFKNSYKLKDFKFLCNNIIQVQGYEHFLLKILVKFGYTFDEIIYKKTDIPHILYIKNGIKHRYFCDIFIPKTNTIYEVKSIWTYKKDIEKIKLTKKACIDAGYLFKLYIFDKNGIKLDI
jgi:hypothetical protein